MTNYIKASGLIKSYGQRRVVNQLNLTVYQGEVLAVIGPNGAGKSTTLDLLLGLRQPDDGNVEYWCGEPRHHIGVQLQTTPFFAGFTALENMRMFAAFYGKRMKKEEIVNMLVRVGLGDCVNTDASKLSGGQQKRLSIAMALTHGPRLVFLDEPTAALDPRARREVRELMMSLANDGTSIVFTSHDMEEVHKMASRIVMIQKGEVIAEGTPEDLLVKYQAESLENLYIQLTEE